MKLFDELIRNNNILIAKVLIDKLNLGDMIIQIILKNYYIDNDISFNT